MKTQARKYRMNARHLLLAAALAGSSLSAAAHGDGAGSETHAKKTSPAVREQKLWGIAGDPKAARRTIRITMTDDMRFSPDSIEVKPGETIRFVVHNAGKMMHEMVIGTKKELDEHAAMMAKFPGMEHDEPYMTHVGPGKTGTILWTFNRPGTFQFACLIAGHYQAGMVGQVRVGTPLVPEVASGERPRR